jgi:hypothetical protein
MIVSVDVDGSRMDEGAKRAFIEYTRCARLPALTASPVAGRVNVNETLLNK